MSEHYQPEREKAPLTEEEHEDWKQSIEAIHAMPPTTLHSTDTPHHRRIDDDDTGRRIWHDDDRYEGTPLGELDQ